MSSYDEPGVDYHNHPSHSAPNYLSRRGQQVFAAIEASLAEQAREGHITGKGNGYLLFRQDSLLTEVDALINVTKLVEVIEGLLPEEEK